MQGNDVASAGTGGIGRGFTILGLFNDYKVQYYQASKRCQLIGLINL